MGAGVVGSVAGGVVAGLTTLAFPAFRGAVVLIGMAAGAFYGVYRVDCSVTTGLLYPRSKPHITPIYRLKEITW